MITFFTYLNRINFRTIIVYLFFVFFCKSNAQPFNIEIFLPNVKITDIKNDGNDIWVSTEGDGIFTYNSKKKKWENFSTDNKKIKQDFFHCIETSSRYIWAGSTNGLFTYDKKRKKWKRKRFKKGGQFGNWIRSLKYDKKNRTLWIGRFRNLSKYNLRKKKYYDYDLTIKKNDKTNSIKSLYLDGDSLLFIGTEAGLHKFNTNGNLRKKQGLSFYDSSKNYFMNESDQVSISDIFAEQNFIWFGTDEFITNENPNFNIGGLYKFDRGIEWIKLSKNNGLNGNGIFDIELVGNYIWVVSYQFNPPNKKQMPRGITLVNRLNMKTIKIENNEIPISVNVLFFDGKNMWIGTNDGIRKIKLTNKLVPTFSN